MRYRMRVQLRKRLINSWYEERGNPLRAIGYIGLLCVDGRNPRRL